MVIENVSLKSPEHGLGINIGKNLNCIPKSLNKCVIEHKKIGIICAKFVEKCAQTRTFPIYHS